MAETEAEALPSNEPPSVDTKAEAPILQAPSPPEKPAETDTEAKKPSNWSLRRQSVRQHLSELEQKPVDAAGLLLPEYQSSPEILFQDIKDAVTFAEDAVRAPIEATGPRLVFFTDASYSGPDNAGCAYALTSITPVETKPLATTRYGVRVTTSTRAELVGIRLALEAAVSNVAAMSVEEWADPTSKDWLRVIILSDCVDAIRNIDSHLVNRMHPTRKRFMFPPATMNDLLQALHHLQAMNVFVQIRWGAGTYREAKVAIKKMEVLPKETMDVGEYKIYPWSDMARTGVKRSRHELEADDEDTNDEPAEPPTKKLKLEPSPEEVSEAEKVAEAEKDIIISSAEVPSST
ncbi:hypothetical protein F5Y17DRAFT_463235 [Xylariaceae sp. FL0594]|nr:hypothetical protein F5Y17DRAFT_463235 [Xylariaceae sp. FL0594]